MKIKNWLQSLFKKKDPNEGRVAFTQQERQPMFAPADEPLETIIKNTETMFPVKLNLVPVEGNKESYESAWKALEDSANKQPGIRLERMGDSFSFNKFINGELDCLYNIYIFEVEQLNKAANV